MNDDYTETNWWYAMILIITILAPAYALGGIIYEYNYKSYLINIDSYINAGLLTIWLVWWCGGLIKAYRE